MRRRVVNGLEQDVVYARHVYTYTHNRHGVIVRWVKRQIHKRERREGKAEARVELW